MRAALVKFSLLMIISIAAATCGGGGGDGDGDQDLSNNACSVLQLPVKIVNGTSCGGLQRSLVVRVVLVDRVGNQGFCSGTMLTASTVLTAAHCIVVARPVRVFVVNGEPLSSASLTEVDSWQVHPGFRGDGNALVADVAVLLLSSPLPLPSLPVLTSIPVQAGDILSIFGYGEDENGRFDFEELQSGEMRADEVATSFIRAKYRGEGSNTCLGDSGGPLIKTVGGTPALVGITSSGTEPDCGEGDNSYFTNLQDPAVLQFLQVEVPGLALM